MQLFRNRRAEVWSSNKFNEELVSNGDENKQILIVDNRGQVIENKVL